MKTEEIELFRQPSLQIGLLLFMASGPCSPPPPLHGQALATKGSSQELRAAGLGGRI